MRQELLGEVTISGRGVVNLPARALRSIGWKRGDRLFVELIGDDMLVLVKRPDAIADAFAGRLTHLFPDPEDTRKFLAAYLLFNDGVQTVIGLASVFLAQELFVRRGLPVREGFLLGLMLMVQVVAFGGALAFGALATALGARKALLASLVVWCGAVVYCYGLLQTEAQAWGAAAVIALVLGGSQALSRSLFSCMIPPGREAAFFSLYEVANSGTSWIGPFLFAVVVSVTGSYRQALLSLIVLFAGGIAILAATDTDRAIRESGQAPPAAPPLGTAGLASALGGP